MEALDGEELHLACPKNPIPCNVGGRATAIAFSGYRFLKTLKLSDLGKKIAEQAMERFAQRFWANVKKSEHGCWEWQGGPAGKNSMYGQIAPPGFGRQIAPHRAAWLLHYGEVPLREDASSLVVRHTCDNPMCVRIDHLVLGTQLDNIRDMYERGRNRHLSGEDHKTSKLTWEQVSAIRSRYALGGITHRTLAKEYGVTHSTIQNLLKFTTWASEKPNRIN